MLAAKLACSVEAQATRFIFKDIPRMADIQALRFGALVGPMVGLATIPALASFPDTLASLSRLSNHGPERLRREQGRGNWLPWGRLRVRKCLLSQVRMRL